MLRSEFADIALLSEVEPMLVGLLFAFGIHLIGLHQRKDEFSFLIIFYLPITNSGQTHPILLLPDNMLQVY
ncbi:MAG: hypothetical protein MZV64_70015 [Ignavibacteriales bacterium]|nr:hypothetical protein [Ignavibacteriales bacterium]